MRTFYTCKDIAGDYAILVSDDGNENQVALAFLPPEIDVGSRLVREDFDWDMA